MKGATILAARRWHSVTLGLAASLGISGCIYHGPPADPMDGPERPVGVTILRIPVEKFVIPAPPPGGISSTCQRMLFDRRRLAANQAQSDAPEKASETKPKEKTDPAGKASSPSA